MTAIYAIKDEDGDEVARIVATAAFVEAVHPGRYEWIEDEVPPVVEPVFPTLTRRQLRLALLSIGVTSVDVEAHIASVENETERAAAMIEWEDASSYERSHPLIVEVAASLDLPVNQVDALWLWAAGL